MRDKLAVGPDKRQIGPEELAAVFKLAARYPDLRVIEAELGELAGLRGRVKRGEAAIAEIRETQATLAKACAALGLKGKVAR